MVYFADLSPNQDEPDALNVGWLAPGQPFPTGPTSERFRTGLRELVMAQSDLPDVGRAGLVVHPGAGAVVWRLDRYQARAVFRVGSDPDPSGQSPPPHFMTKTYGRHGCFRCQDDFDFPTTMIELVHDGRRLPLGSGTLRVVGADGTAYVAPELVAHYVLEHDYQPPAGFVAAVEAFVAEPLQVLLEPCSGEAPREDAPLPPDTSQLRFVWRKHSDLPATPIRPPFALEVHVGSALDVRGVPALVVPANKQLTLGWGTHVAEKVLKRAGREVEAEALAAHPQGVELGDAALTGAGALEGFTHLVHAAVLDKYDFNPLFLLRLRERTSEATLRRATASALRCAAAAGLPGLVFTAMGAGIGGMSQAKCARIMVETTRATLDELGDAAPSRVVFACLKPRHARCFRQALAADQGSPRA